MKNRRTYYIYIMANETGKAIYIGVTNDLYRRVQEHKEMKTEGFTKRYKLTSLVYYEATNNVVDAIGREKEIKGWVRPRKNDLIESMNPGWRDLYENLFK